MADSAILIQSVGLLNPFRGVINIIDHKGAEAVPVDGINRDIYVKALRPASDLQNSGQCTDH